MEQNRKLLNLKYSDTNFDVSNDVDEVSLLIYTKAKQGSRKKEAKIAEIFDAKDVMYVEQYIEDGHEEHPAFWCLRLVK